MRAAARGTSSAPATPRNVCVAAKVLVGAAVLSAFNDCGGVRARVDVSCAHDVSQCRGGIIYDK